MVSAWVRRRYVVSSSAFAPFLFGSRTLEAESRSEWRCTRCPLPLGIGRLAGSHFWGDDANERCAKKSGSFFFKTRAQSLSFPVREDGEFSSPSLAAMLGPVILLYSGPSFAFSLFPPTIPLSRLLPKPEAIPRLLDAPLSSPRDFVHPQTRLHPSPRHPTYPVLPSHSCPSFYPPSHPVRTLPAQCHPIIADTFLRLLALRYFHPQHRFRGVLAAPVHLFTLFLPPPPPQPDLVIAHHSHRHQPIHRLAPLGISEHFCCLSSLQICPCTKYVSHIHDDDAPFFDGCMHPLYTCLIASTACDRKSCCYDNQSPSQSRHHHHKCHCIL